MRRRKRNKKQVKIVIGTTLCLLLIMTVGYAAFSTTLNITAKGNVVGSTTFLKLTKDAVSSGNGLYKDLYEEGKYTYRGDVNNNYIKFEGDLWRILSINGDGTAKIMKDKSIGKLAFDEATGDTSGPRYNDSNTYCKRLRPEGYYAGCNAWAKVDGTFSHDGYSGTVTADSTLNTYLNTTYYNGLSEASKKSIVKGDFNFGVPHDNDDIATEIVKEKKYVWNGFVGLISPSEYLRTSFDEKCNTIQSSFTNNTCTDNYIYKTMVKYGDKLIPTLSGRMTYHTFAITISNQYTAAITGGNSSGKTPTLSFPYDVKPVLYIKNDVMLLGVGTESNPYTIK